MRGPRIRDTTVTPQAGGWTQHGTFTWKRDIWTVQWNGMPASYAVYRAGYHVRTFETPDAAKRYADEEITKQCLDAN